VKAGGQPGQQSEFKASLDNKERPCLKTEKFTLKEFLKIKKLSEGYREYDIS
jgi:hypothetical protein